MVTQSVKQKESPYLTGAGLIAQGDVDKNGGIEIALFYLDKFYLRRQGDDHITEKIKRMYVTTGYRHWFNKSFSSALAIYSSYSMGDARVVHDENTGGDVPTTATEITEYGLDVSIQVELISNDELALVADSRYSQSLTAKSREDANVYGILLGLKYLIPKERFAHSRPTDPSQE